MSSEVAKGYDDVATKLGARTIEERKKSPTIHLRFFNNWIKSYLIDKYCPNNPIIFDCACGKGGDIPKYRLKNPKYVIFGDISEESFHAVREKIPKDRRETYKWASTFIIGDIFGCNILETLIPGVQFDISSCQMALHYAFGSPDNARQSIENLTHQLQPGGYILITTLNACRIVKQFLDVKDQKGIANSLFSMEREFDLDDIPPFGAKYYFELEQSVAHIPEFLVHPKVLIELFKEKNCELIEMCPFHDFYHKSVQSRGKPFQLFLELLNKTGLENADMTPEEWNIIDLYSFYVFQKHGEPNQNNPTVIPNNHEPYEIKI